MRKKTQALQLPATVHPILPPHFHVQIGEIRPTPLPPQFDTTNLELLSYGRLEYITSPEHNNNGEASIKLGLCIRSVIKLISG